MILYFFIIPKKRVCFKSKITSETDPFFLTTKSKNIILDVIKNFNAVGKKSV